jgi:hypothetical protein
MFHSIFRQCQQTGGVLLAQPEHILSLRLRTVEQFCLTGPSSSLVEELLNLQDWLHRYSRLLLDESDELLKVKYQLVYTIGTSSDLTGQPRRAELIQDVLSRLGDTACHIVESHPEYSSSFSIELGANDGRFAHIRILDRSSSITELLFDKLIASVLHSLSFRSFSTEDDAMLRRYVTTRDVPETVPTHLKARCGSAFESILVLRGLFAHKLLEHVLTDKRFRVDYGLHLVRTMLAVPYRSKDQPAVRAEFGHPDVILLLTLLSYYYTGLTNDQLDLSFDFLMKSDNPGMRYEVWIQPIKCRLSPALHSIDGLNLEDINQKNNHLFPHLRFNKAVVDYYVSHVVFPKAREFPVSVILLY